MAKRSETHDYPGDSELVKTIKRALTKQSESELDEKQLNLLRLCRKLVAVEYRNRYGSNVYETPETNYNEKTNE